MTVDKESQIVLKSDYLFNEKTGNCFIIRSQILNNGIVIDNIPVRLSSGLIEDALNGERNSKLKAFKQISTEEFFPTYNDFYIDVLLERFSNPQISNFKAKGYDCFRNLSTDLKRSQIRRDKPTMTHAEGTVKAELDGVPKLIFEFSVLTRFKSGGYGIGKFISPAEQRFIDNFVKLEEDDKNTYYANLRHQMSFIVE